MAGAAAAAPAAGKRASRREAAPKRVRRDRLGQVRVTLGSSLGAAGIAGAAMAPCLRLGEVGAGMLPLPGRDASSTSVASFFDVQLVNGPFGDPALHVDLLHDGRAFLFDMGDLAALPPRKLLRVS